MLGQKIGTGGSSGQGYLKETVDKHKVFTDFANIATLMISRSYLPKLPTSVKKNLGFLSGNTGLYNRLTAEEMVKYYADLHEMPDADFQKSRDRLFALLNMEEFAGRRIGKLSTGMMQKVNIARTMIHEPDVVVFDEPTSGLDVMASRSIIRLIKECGEEGRTVIFSSHRLAEIQLLCDDLAIIHKGELYFNGTYKEFDSQQQENTLEDEFIRLVGEGEHV